MPHTRGSCVKYFKKTPARLVLECVLDQQSFSRAGHARDHGQPGAEFDVDGLEVMFPGSVNPDRYLGICPQTGR
jgi:hypothetical protein